MRSSLCTTFQMRTESGLEGHRVESLKLFRMMVARDGVEPPTPAFSVRSTGLTTPSINNLTRQDGRFIVTIP
jgi:hypothetical protein